MCSCSDLRCILRWKHDGDIPDNFVSFLVSHGIMRQDKCPTHKLPGTPHKSNPSLSICWRRNCGAKCRKRLTRLAPFFSSKQKKPEMKFMLWIKLCQRVEMAILASQCKVARRTVFKWKKQLLLWIHKAVLKRNEEIKFSRCAVDETYLFPRKYHRRCRVRKRSFYILLGQLPSYNYWDLKRW